MGKSAVKKKLPNAYCVKLATPVSGMRYIVWPAKVQPRGFEQGAIGAGITARKAWCDAWFNLKWRSS